MTVLCCSFDAHATRIESYDDIDIVRLGMECLVGADRQLSFQRTAIALSESVSAMPTPHIVYSHHWTASVAAHALRRRGAQHILIDHGHQEASLTQSGLTSEYIAFALLAERALFASANAIAFVSTATRDEARALGLWAHGRAASTIMRNPVAGCFTTMSLPRPRPSRVIYVGRAEAMKGFGLFLELTSRAVAKRVVDVADVFLPFGREQATPRILESWGARWALPLGPNILRVHCGRDRTSIAQAMQEGGVLLHPSRSESCGLAVLEALAMGLPVVASDLPALAEMQERLDARHMTLVPRDASASEWVMALQRTRFPSADEQQRLRRRIRSQYAISNVLRLLAKLEQPVPRIARRPTHRGRPAAREHVLLITPEVRHGQYGGIGTWVEAYLAGADQSQHADITVLVLRDGSERPLTVVPFGAHLRHVLVDRAVTSLMALRMHLAKERYSIVHVQLPEYIAFARTLDLVGEPAIVYTAHSLMTQESLHGATVQPGSQLVQMLGADAVAFVAATDMTAVRTHLPRSCQQIHAHISNAIVARPRHRAVNRTSSITRLVYFGRWVPHKKVSQLVLSFAIAARVAPHLRLLLIGRGHGEDAYEEAITRRIQADPWLAERTECTPWLPPTELAARLKECSAFVSVAAYEPHGYCYHEAAAAKLPLLVTATDGAVQLLGQDYPFLQPPRCAPQLVQLASDLEALRARCTAKYRAYARAHRPIAMYQQYRALYRATHKIQPSNTEAANTRRTHA